MLIWYSDEYFLHHFCGYLVVHWKQSLSYLHNCFLHNEHSIKYMTYALEQLTSWKILYVLWICWLLNVDVVVSWWQHRVLLFLKRKEHFPGFKVHLFVSFMILFSILLLPMSSLRFLLRLKAVTGSFWKVFFRDLLTDSMFQFLRIILLMLDQNQLYVIA